MREQTLTKCEKAWRYKTDNNASLNATSKKFGISIQSLLKYRNEYTAESTPRTTATINRRGDHDHSERTVTVTVETTDLNFTVTGKQNSVANLIRNLQ